MSNICSYELAVDEYKAEQERIHKKEISDQFVQVLLDLFCEATFKYKEEGNNYSKDKQEIVEYLWNYIKEKV